MGVIDFKPKKSNLKPLRGTPEKWIQETRDRFDPPEKYPGGLRRLEDNYRFDASGNIEYKLIGGIWTRYRCPALVCPQPVFVR